MAVTGLPLSFSKDCWNIFDGVLVTMWLVEIALRDFIQLDPAILRILVAGCFEPHPANTDRWAILAIWIDVSGS